MINGNKKISLFASSGTWIEGEAIRQLEMVAALNGMERVAGFPDLHPSKGSPVGAALLSTGEFYPYLIGSDIGCGMSFFATEIAAQKAKPEKWFKRLKCLDEQWNGDASEWLERSGTSSEYTAGLGTIGQGNHFAELVRVHEIHDRQAFAHVGLSDDILYLLVHSGSRGLGELLLRDHVDRFGSGSLKCRTEDAQQYLAKHDNALLWAAANRELIAYRMIEQLGGGYRLIVSLAHNLISVLDGGSQSRYLHRKGAAPSDRGPVIIPGSRGSLSYLVMSSGDQEQNLWSVAHGAGRKWKRSECRGRLRNRYSAESLVKTKLGSFVVCEDRELLYEEAPQAYKDIEGIIGDMVSFGMISVVASFRPILTYKGRRK